VKASRPYNCSLTAQVNRKGVLDIDVVKGCTAGITAHGPTGCYGACYAAAIAKFRGLDFSRAVTRTVHNSAQARQIERIVRQAPQGFFRIGTMGDPSHAWGATVALVKWLAPYAVPVIVTKHWHRASDDDMQELVGSGAVLNTSLSALDTPAELRHRERERERYAMFGGHSVTRLVSCDFNPEHETGAALLEVQARLYGLRPLIDNPLRVSRSHRLVQEEVIRVSVEQDLTARRTVSLARPQDVYLGTCAGCSDICGLGIGYNPSVKPLPPQYAMDF